MKKIISALLVLMMILAMAAPALAEIIDNSNDNLNDGKITIMNAVVNQDYTIFRILKLVKYNTDTKAAAYKPTDAWKSFIESKAINGVYVNVDDNGYVTWNGEGEKAADVKKFAELAREYAKSAMSSVTSEGSKKAESTTVKFENLKLGYYLVNSSVGTLCSLDTTNKEVEMTDKNEQPKNEKKVEEDSNKKYGETNDAEIGQTINFKSTITAQAGAQNYVFHDKMSAGLTYKGVTGITLNGTTVDAKYYTITAGGSETDEADKCTFEVTFTQDFCDTLKANDVIVISYTAELNENAAVGLAGNPNESKLTYGEKGDMETTTTTTTTYTWDMEIFKFTYTDSGKTKTEALSGVEFVLVNAKDEAATQVATFSNGKLTGWTNIPAAGEDGAITWPDNTKLTTGADGKIHIDGLDSDTYYLREIKAPLGYNKLTEDVAVTIKGAEQGENNELSYETVVAKVENKSGTVLPSTGGIGTTIFYVVGGLMVLVAVVLLVTKKKMSSDSGKD